MSLSISVCLWLFLSICSTSGWFVLLAVLVPVFVPSLCGFVFVCLCLSLFLYLSVWVSSVLYLSKLIKRCCVDYFFFYVRPWPLELRILVCVAF